ncbi:transposase [Bradyrhizobium sp. AUGA SZCCT0042]|nr:transposase [Bradyrhizobium sp. AUGA SZCCT0042]
MHEGKTLLYRASKLDCDVCPLKPQCCAKDPSRKIPRDIHEHARDVARSFADTEGFEKVTTRAQEDRDAVRTLERILKLGRLRLRGPRGAQESLLLLPSPRTCGGSRRWPLVHHPLRLCASRSVRVARASGPADQSRSPLAK